MRDEYSGMYKKYLLLRVERAAPHFGIHTNNSSLFRSVFRLRLVVVGQTDGAGERSGAQGPEARKWSAVPTGRSLAHIPNVKKIDFSAVGSMEPSRGP